MEKEETFKQIFLCTASVSQKHPILPQYICRCYSDKEIVLENLENGTQTSRFLQNPIVKSYMYTTSSEIYLILVTGYLVLITYTSKDKEFFEMQRTIYLQNKFLVTSISHLELDQEKLIAFGHYDGLITILRGTSLHSFQEVPAITSFSQVLNFPSYNKSSITKILFQTNGFGHHHLIIAYSKGLIEGFSLEITKATILFSKYQEYITMPLPMDITVKGDSIIIVGAGGVQIFTETLQKEVKVESNLTCVLSRDQDFFCTDEKGKIYLLKDEKITFVKKLSSYIVGYGKHKGKLLFFDHCNRFIEI